MSAPLLEVSGLAVNYGVTQPAQALRDVSFTLQPGEALGVVGESGCGKTTLMLALMRLLPGAGRIIAGEIRLDGVDLLALNEQEMAAVRWRRVAMVFQGAMNALNPVRTVGDQIAEGVRRSATAITLREAERRTGELLELVGIGGGRQRQYPHQYSGGMRQRAMIAMALACQPTVLIADEPTTALDVMVQAQIIELLGALRRDLGLAVILVTHDLGVVTELCERVLVMYGGMVAEQGATADSLQRRVIPTHRRCWAPSPIRLRRRTSWSRSRACHRHW
jgi:ABC-type glutathione transport system ATPase component